MSSPFNHVLLNEYQFGQGIASHKDGPLYHNVVAVLNLGSSAVIDFFSEITMLFNLFL